MTMETPISHYTSTSSLLQSIPVPPGARASRAAGAVCVRSPERSRTTRCSPRKWGAFTLQKKVGFRENGDLTNENEHWAKRNGHLKTLHRHLGPQRVVVFFSQRNWGFDLIFNHGGRVGYGDWGYICKSSMTTSVGRCPLATWIACCFSFWSRFDDILGSDQLLRSASIRWLHGRHESCWLTTSQISHSFLSGV